MSTATQVAHAFTSGCFYSVLAEGSAHRRFLLGLFWERCLGRNGASAGHSFASSFFHCFSSSFTLVIPQPLGIYSAVRPKCEVLGALAAPKPSLGVAV